MVVTAQSASAGLKPSADADEFNVASGTIPGNEHWASLPQAHGLVGEKESHTAFPNTDSGYGSTTSSPELNRESTSTSLLIDKAMNLKERIFPREKKVLKHYSRTLTPVENARYADLRILFGYALSEWLLNHKRPSAAIEMRIAVMGETETSTELFILVACQKPIVKIVRQFFAQKAIKDELQPSNKVWPKFEVIVRQQLALYSGDNRTTARVAFNSDFDEDRGDLYGTRILLKSKGKSRVARLGGCLWIENSHGNVHCYGLTVGHIHSTPPASPDEETSQHSGERYEGRVSSPIQGPSEVGGTRGFVESSHDFSSETDDDYDDAQDEDEDGYEIPCWGTPGEVQVSGWEPAQASFVRFIGDIIDDDTFTGSVLCSSGNLDWALVDLGSQTRFRHVDNLDRQKTSLQSTPSLLRVAAEDIITTGQFKDVTVARAGSNVQGRLSKQESAIMFGFESTFADVYTLSGFAALCK